MNCLQGKISPYVRKQERSKIYYTSFHINKLKKKEQIKPKVSRWKGTRKTKAEISELEKSTRKINEKIFLKVLENNPFRM